jgi:hypothetical protein
MSLNLNALAFNCAQDETDILVFTTPKYTCISDTYDFTITDFAVHLYRFLYRPFHYNYLIIKYHCFRSMLIFGIKFFTGSPPF